MTELISESTRSCSVLYLLHALLLCYYNLVQNLSWVGPMLCFHVNQFKKKTHFPKNKTHESACYGKLSSLFAAYISGKSNRSQAPKYLKSLHERGNLAWQLATRCGSVYRQCVKKFVLQCLSIRGKPRKRLEMMVAVGVLCVVVMKLYLWTQGFIILY